MKTANTRPEAGLPVGPSNPLTDPPASPSDPSIAPSSPPADPSRPPTEPAPTDHGGYTRLWQSGAFRKLWVAQFVSSMGDWLIIGILVPTVTELSGGSSMAVAGIMIAKILPALLLSGVVGAIVDRFPRRDIMIVADLARLGLVLILLV
ncbi:MAG: MFS transporter, partial [Actinomycetes bacterium]|nr:MFS transporter [Actinomycetes bacterium]